MHAENALVDDGRNGQVVEHTAEVSPQADGVATLALIIEAIQTRDGNTLVVATEREDFIRILDLVCHEKAHSLDALLATVDEISNEQKLVDGWRSTCNFE